MPSTNGLTNPFENAINSLNVTQLNKQKQIDNYNIAIAQGYEPPQDILDAIADIVSQVDLGLDEDALSRLEALIQNIVDEIAPIITSNGGEDTATIAFDENSTALVTTVMATDRYTLNDETHSLEFSISGADAAFFQIDPVSGELSFLSPPDYEGGPKTYEIVVQVSDGSFLVDTQTITIDIVDGNDAPVVAGPIIAGSISEDDLPLSIDLLSGASDPDTSDSLNVANIVLTSGAPAGVTIVGNSLDIDPSAYNSLAVGESEVISYSYDIVDGNGGSVAQTATFTITGANDAPIATDDVFATDEDTALNIAAVGVLANDSDIDAGDVLTVSSYDALSAAGAAVSVNADGSFGYDPNGQFEYLAAGESTTDTFTYIVSDGNDGTDTATVTITISGLNDEPTLAAGIGAAVEDGPTVDVDLAALGGDIDSDDDGTSLSYAITGAPSEGSAAISGTTLTFDPNTDFQDLALGETRDVVIQVTATDSHGAAAMNEVTVTVTGANDGPVASDDGFATDEDTTLNVAAAGVLANDSDIDAIDIPSVLTFDATSTNGGFVSVSADGGFSYDPNGQFEYLAAGESTTDKFTYTVSDGNGGTDTATATITINGVNDAPMLEAGALAAVEDGGAVSLNLSTIASDIDSDDDGTSLSYTITGSPSEGSATISGTTLSFDSGADFQDLALGETRDVTIQVTATDGHGATAVNDVTVTVEGVNDGVVLLDGFERGLSSRWESVGPTSTIGGTLGTTQSEGNQALWLFAQWGSASEEEIEELIGYELPDGWGRGDAITREYYFEAGDIVSFDYRITSGGENDSFYLDPNLGIVFIDEGASNYYKTRSFEIPEDGYYDLTFGSASMLLDRILLVPYGATNTGPVAEDDRYSIDEDSVLNLPAAGVLGNDSDVDFGDVLTVTSFDATSVGGGIVSINADGSFSYDPNGQFDHLETGESIADTFTYTVSDSSGATDTATATITVNGVSDGPVFENFWEGTDARETFSGYLGDSLIVGNGGDDALYGDARGPFVYDGVLRAFFDDPVTGSDNSLLNVPLSEARAGDDMIHGGAGHDTIAGDHGDGASIYTISSGGRSLDVFWETGNDTIFGGDGNDRIDGDGRVSLNFRVHGTSTEVVLGNDIINGGAGENRIYGEGSGVSAQSGQASGGNNYAFCGDDTIYGGDTNDEIYGEAYDLQVSDWESTYSEIGLSHNLIDAGNDVVDGGNGDDTLYGDSKSATARTYDHAVPEEQDGSSLNEIYGGNDDIVGGLGTDLIFGDFKTALASSYQDFDVSVIVAGDDHLDGGEGDDWLYGEGVSAEAIDGGGVVTASIQCGNDTLIGGAGDDNLVGDFATVAITGDGLVETGADTFVFSPGSGLDTIHDFEVGKDKIDISGYGVTATDFSTWAVDHISESAGQTVIDFDGTTDDIDHVTILTTGLDSGDFLLS